MEENRFSINMTQLVKGVAIIAMIVHHSIRNNTGIPVDLSLSNIGELIGSSAKVCVCLFTILSGFGLTLSWNKKEKHKNFIFNHIIKLWFSFLFIYLFVVVLRIFQGKGILNVYGRGKISILYVIKDILGLQNFIIETPTLSGVWWYMETIFICYLLFPIFHKITKAGKKTSIIFLIILYIPWVIYFISKGWGWHTDRELFYLFSFELGIICAQYKIFDKIVSFSKNKKIISIIISTIIMFVMLLIRSKLCLIVDPFFGLSIIAFCICLLSKVSIISELFCDIGKYSSDIYMFHSVVLTSMKSISFSKTIYRIIAVIFICWSIAIVLEKIKKLIKYDKLIKKVVREEN